MVSDKERESAVGRLTAAFTDDAIPVDEFERRVALVYTVESPAALQEIMSDLPAAASGATNVPAPLDRSTAIARPPHQRIASVLGNVERSLHGPIPESLEVRSLMSNVELDLRGAEFPPGVTEINVRAIMGNVEVVLPNHVRVEDEARAFLASFSLLGRTRTRDGEATPVVRLTGSWIMANVEVAIDDS